MISQQIERKYQGRPVMDMLTLRAGYVDAVIRWYHGQLVVRVRYASGNSGYVRTDMLRWI